MSTLQQIKNIRAYFAANPEGTAVIRAHGSITTYSRQEYAHWFYSCLLSKIYRNEKQTGRKHTEEWQRNCQRLARMVNGRTFTRRRDAAFCKSIAARLEHRLHDNHE